MSTEFAINRPAETPPGAAPVAMQRGRRRDRIALARLRVKRRWLLRRRHKATLAPSPPTPTALPRGPNEVRPTPGSRARNASGAFGS